MQKVIRDGLVAVLVSPGFGAGWSTWADQDIEQQLLFDPDVVAWVESGKLGALPDLEAKYGDAYFYTGGADDLVIQWVPQGQRFRIEEYDGSETLVFEEEYQWVTA